MKNYKIEINQRISSTNGSYFVVQWVILSKWWVIARIQYFAFKIAAAAMNKNFIDKMNVMFTK